MHRKPWKTYAVSIAIPLLVGALSALLSRSGMEAFETLEKPAFAPGAALFPVVWTILYILMGVSAALIWESRSSDRGDALFYYALQLFVNFWWPIFFFVWEMRVLAFWWILVLIALVAIMLRRFYRIRPLAAWLNVPYLLWLVFAAWLNLSIWLLNR